MSWMFNKCYKLKKIKGINNFNINKVTKMESMFNACKNLTNLDKSKFKSYFYPNKINNKKQEKNENIFAVNFISLDQNIQFPMACRDTDIFSDLEKKLYLEYPQLKNKNLYFIANGNVVDKTLSLKKNKITSGTGIIITNG